MTADARSLLPAAGALWSAAWSAIPPGVARLLEEGGTALEIGCGRGLACLALAQAFPAARVVGHDPDPEAIAHATALAADSGRDERLRFAAGDSMRLPRGTFALVVVSRILARPDPEGLLNAIRNALLPAGACLVLEAAGVGAIARHAGFSRARLHPWPGPLQLWELGR
jgi:SAM-dependent methyltransferase